MKIWRNVWILCVVAAAVVLSFHAGVVYAADPRLTDADALLEKAFLQVLHAENPGVEPPFGGHDLLARKHIRKARNQIALAIAYADEVK